jgi:hypothetical protein
MKGNRWTKIRLAGHLKMASSVLLLFVVLTLHAMHPLAIIDPLAVIAAYVALGSQYNVMWLRQHLRS